MSEQAIHLMKVEGSPSEIANLQSVFEAAPDYRQRISGRAPHSHEAMEMLSALPPGRASADKFIYLIESGSEVIGCADVIRGYPDSAIAWIGLLLLSERHQKTGLGRKTFVELERQIARWSQIQTIRLSVILTNDHIIPFWVKMGFKALGAPKAYTAEHIETKVQIFEKCLRRVELIS